MRCKKKIGGKIAAAFGIGQFLAFCLPSKALIILLALLLITCGAVLALK